MIEIVLIVALVQVGVMLALPAIAAGVSARSQMLLSTALLVFLAAPAIFWRCMVQQMQVPDATKGRAPRSTGVGSATAVTAATQVLGLVLTAACVSWQQQSTSAAAQEKFGQSAQQIEVEVRRHFDLPLLGLNGLRGMFAADAQVTPTQFRAWVASRDLPAEFPGVRGFGFIEYVGRDDLEAFIAAQRADGNSEFTVDSAGNASDLYVVKYIEPIAFNRAALGKDAGREAVRREAAERAARSGTSALSGRVTLAQDGNQGAGFLYFTPVYRSGSTATTAQERQSDLVGLLYTPIVAAELLKGVTEVAQSTLDIEVFEGESAQPGGLFYSSRVESSGNAKALGQESSDQARQSVRTLVVGGRTLALRVTSTPAFEALIDSSSIRFITVGGVLVSFLMALTVWLLSVGRVRAQRRAQRMTVDLARLARVVQHTSNSVVITDAQMRINWVNEGFTRLTGYTFEEAAGRTPGELLRCDNADPAALKILLNSVAAGEPCRVDILNRARDGREYWVDTEIKPARDEHGVLTGFMEVGSDITVQKYVRMQLEAAMRESDALLRTLHQHAIVSVADRAGTILEVNEAFCNISGYSREELLGQNHRIVNSRLQAQSFWIDMWRTISSGAPWRGEICNRAKDGSLYWVDSMIAPFMAADGTIEKYVSIRTDISASKTAQQQLGVMADRLTLAIEGGSDGLWDWMDVSVDAQWWSPSFYAMLGYQPSELVASDGSIQSLLHVDRQASYQKAIEDALAGNNAFDMELLLRTHGGEYRWFRSRAKVTSDSAGRVGRMAGSMQDIHDRKQAERELARERQRLGHILEGTNVGAWEWNIETGKTDLSERWAAITGHTLNELGITTIQTWTQNTHPDDRAHSAILLEQHFNGDLAYYECEARARHKHGYWVWVLDRGKLFARSEDGRPRLMAGTRMDITQRKQVEQALRASEAFLDRAGRIAGVGGWLMGIATESMSWSDQTCRIHEVSPGQQRSMEEAISFYPPAARAVLKSAMQASIAQGSSWDLDLPLVTATGRAIWVRVVGEAECEEGKVVQLVGTFQDITQRRALDEELRRSNELMTGVLQNLPCGLSVFDSDLRLLTYNKQFQQLLNLPDALLDAPDVTFDQFVRFSAEGGEYPTDQIDEIVAQDVAQARRPNVQFFERQRLGGVPMDVRRAPIPGGGFIITYTDISTRKQAEISLKEALIRAEQASVTKSQFLANMSHEIRTPMNAILGMLSLLHKTSLTPRQLDYTSKTEGAARSLLGLLNDILDFSKAEAGKMFLDPRPFGVDQLLRDLSVILSANIGAKAIDVLFDVDPTVPPWLLGDDMRLRQVLINLAGNAVKFTEAGEVVLRLKVVNRTDDHVMLDFAVRDSGIGIAPENQARIFTGFSQAEASTTRRFGGTGLGLAICQRLVTLLGGELRVRSTFGEGSTFHFQIRLAIAPTPIDDSVVSGAVMRHFRILIVDDNETARELFIVMARSLGWQAEAVASNAEAIALAQSRAAQGLPFDTVLVDWQMAEKDAWGTSRRLVEITRAVSSRSPLLIMVTSHAREALAHLSADQQALLGGFLVKPVTASMLFDAVSEARKPPAHPAGSKSRVTLPAVQRLAGLRLLIVEDNLTNQQVAQELLCDEGAQVVVAANGQLAVDAVAAASPLFDAVLMDLQMPVMDGYTATAQIRRNLGSTPLPIIAMTANVMASDREACLAAGMNDHVGKPFDLPNLVAVLLRHTGRDAVPLVSTGPVLSLLHTDLLEKAERRSLNLAAALRRMGGNVRVYLGSLQSFADDLPARPDQLAELVQQGRFSEAVGMMHTLKGLAATLGLGSLASLAKDAESAFGGAVAPERCQSLIEQLRAAVGTAQQDIALIAQTLNPSVKPVIFQAEVGFDVGQKALDPRQGFRRSLDELISLLRGADMRALEVFEKLQEAHAENLQEAAQPLDEALAALDFDLALSHCEALKKRLDE